MYVQVGGPDWGEILPLFFVTMIGVAVFFWLIYIFVKNKDNSQSLLIKKVKVLEKPVQQGNVEWYVVECEDGQRLKLRSFRANHIMITVGDVGIISYRGKTIQDFKRQV